MKSKCFALFHIKPIVVFLLCLVMFVPIVAKAEEQDQTVVRVGWFDSSFCYWDRFGRRCGIDYEYQHKIAAYTGWTYEYVEDSWPNLFQMLKDGEIDMLCDVSYSQERTEFVSFPDLPMGYESYYIYVDAADRMHTADNLSAFNGARIGVNAGSIQEGFLKDWAEKNNIVLEVIPLVVDEEESMEMVTRGEIDGYASIYTFSSEQKVTPSCRIGESEYYYAVNKNRPDLLAELNTALGGIQDEDPFFNQRLNEERLYNTRTNAFLTPMQEDWLAEHDVIRIGYRDNYIPFCQTDKETSELTGALKDYLAHAANNLRRVDIHFEAIPFASTQEAIDAMKAGEIDCVFPVYLHSYDSDEMGVRLTNPAMTTEMNAVMRATSNQTLSPDSTITFAVCEGDLNIETFVKAQYPASEIKVFTSMQRCYSAVALGEADCVLVSNYRIPSAEDIMKKLKLFSVPSGETMPMSFAVNGADRELYFLLNQTVVMTKSEDMDSALASYMHYAQKVSFEEFLKDNWVGVIAILTVVFLVIIVLLLEKLKVERKSNEQQRMMEEGLLRELRQKEQLQSAMEMAYRDPLTGVKSKHAYNEAGERMNQCIKEGLAPEFSVVVFDLNNLKTINDTRGHEAGDEYIKDACRMICSFFKHSDIFRIGGDEFTAILEAEDYVDQDALLARFEKQVMVNQEQGKTVVAFGCSRFDLGKDKSFRMVFERADALMYKKKMELKNRKAPSGKEISQPKDSLNYENISVINVRRHILIAEDVETNREILGRYLQDDYDVIYACDGIEALEILESRKDDIALVILDLYMPGVSGREVMTRMQVDEELMLIPVIFISVDMKAELDCLKIGAMDFLPKPYPDVEIIKARVAKCIELSENRDLIRRTQRDKLTGLFNYDYFLRYVHRYDQHYKETAFDAIVCIVNRFRTANEQYGRQFGDLMLRSIGISLGRLARKTGGIGCRKEGDIFLLYCPHQDDYEQLLRDSSEDLPTEETFGKVDLCFGVYANAHQEPDIEERFVRAKSASDSIENDPWKTYGYYEFSSD